MREVLGEHHGDIYQDRGAVTLDISNVKKTLNREVIHDGVTYLLSGVTIRRHRKEQKFYYEAELRDIKNGGWVVTCPLREVECKDD